MGGHDEGRGGERKSFIRHRTPVVGRNARVVWLSFRFLVEERPVRELYQAKVSRNTFPKLIAVVFNWNNGLRRVPRLLALIPGVCVLHRRTTRRDSEWDVRKREISTWRKSSEVVSYRGTRGEGERGLVLEIIIAGKERHRYLIRKFGAPRFREAERRVLIDWNFANIMKGANAICVAFLFLNEREIWLNGRRDDAF